VYQKDTSQSKVAIPLQCDEIFNEDFITNSLLNFMVKELWKSVKVNSKSIVERFSLTVAKFYVPLCRSTMRYTAERTAVKR